MRNLKELNQLLSDFNDIDSWSYEFIKSNLQKGMFLSITPLVAQNIVGKTLGAKQVPLLLDLLNTVVFNVAQKAYSSVDHNFKIRRHCHKVIVFEDETIEMDIFLKDKNKKMGVRQLNLAQIKEASERPSEILMDRFFAENLLTSQKVLLWVRVREFSQTRMHFENQELISDSRKYYEKITNKTSWNSKLGMMIFEDEPIQIYNRSALWGYDNQYWKQHMQGQDIIPFYENKMQLNQINIRHILLLEEFIANFTDESISNEQILKLSEKSCEYENRVHKLIKNLEENNYVES